MRVLNPFMLLVKKFKNLHMSLISFKLTIDFIQSISKSIAIWH